MTVILTSPVEGKQPGAEYTGANEDYLLASGYAKRAGYTGPGVANTGPADTTVAKNREFDKLRGERAANSDLPFRGTNDGVVFTTHADGVDKTDPQVAYTGPEA